MRRKKIRSSKEAETSKTRLYLIVGGIVIGAAALLALLFFSLQTPEALAGLRFMPGQDRGHDEAVEYDTILPPSGGIHSGVWQNCGIYEEPVDAKHAVHSMEHGAVWMTYQPGLSAEVVAELKEMARGEPFVLMSPYPELPAPVVMTAWGVQLVVDELPDDRIAEFVERYQLGPQTPEPGALCTEGTGVPTG